MTSSIKRTCIDGPCYAQEVDIEGEQADKATTVTVLIDDPHIEGAVYRVNADGDLAFVKFIGVKERRW